ncbi:hypothetical protein ACVMGC_004841 [Bradyrhizobium barranii subsp. barranii]
MDTHKNAALTPKAREAMVRSVIEGGLTKAAAALKFNVSAKEDGGQMGQALPRGRHEWVA